MRKVWTNYLSFILIILFFFPKIANAYLDPGSGSYIFQLLLGVIFSLIFTTKLFFQKIKNFLIKVFRIKR
jgi:uncharacterized membrane protein